jgi:hypothetical protein
MRGTGEEKRGSRGYSQQEVLVARRSEYLLHLSGQTEGTSGARGR